MTAETGEAGRRTESEVDPGLLALALVARLHAKPVDPYRLHHEFARGGEPLGELELVRAAKSLELKAKWLRCDWERLGALPLPAIVTLARGRFAVLAKVAPDKALILEPTAQAPETLARERFLAAWTGDVILIAPRLTGTGVRTRFDITWFIPALLRYKHLLAEVLIASFFLQLFALVSPLFFQVIIDKVLVHRGLSTLDLLALGLLAVFLFEVLLGGVRTYLFAHTTSRIDVTLGAMLYEHLFRLPMSYFESRRVGDTVARVRELENIRSFLTGASLTVVIDLFFTAIFFVVMYCYTPLLTGVVLGALPFYAALSLLVTPALRRRVQEKFNRGAESQAFLVESVHGAQTIKAAAVEPQGQRGWEERLAGYVAASFRATNLGNVASQCAALINKVVLVSVLWLGARLVMEGELSVGQLVAFNMLSARVSAPILRLVQLWQDFQQAGVSVERLGDILNCQPECPPKPSRSSLPALEGNITFEHVSFRYAGQAAEALQDVSLHVSAGEAIGIVGPSGSGKSTLTKLVQRLYVPQSGRVLVDGVDLALVDSVWLRRSIGVVLQESFLFNRSIRENIALSDPTLPIEAVVAAARLAGAHEFIVETLEGYDSVVGESGSTLSGGQRQRIAIARALVARPRILILDEATSALDYDSERLIHENMRAICANRTVLIISHRLNTLRHADRILVLDRGRIVEQGRHEELVRRRGLYARLHALQSGSLQIVS